MAYFIGFQTENIGNVQHSFGIPTIRPEARRMKASVLSPSVFPGPGVKE
jgi:hypothetical protein